MKRLVLAMLAMVLVPACHKDKDSNHNCEPVWHTPNGYPVCVWEPTPDGLYHPSIESGHTTMTEILQTLDQRVEEFIILHPDLDPATVRSVARGIHFIPVDDYVFRADPNYSGAAWAAGQTDGSTYIKLALWTRGTTELTTGTDPSGVPANAPPHTIRGPAYANPTYYPFWRYGTRPLLPATAHEIGHIFYGPNFEH